MGLFDTLKEQVKNAARNAISNEADKVIKEKGEQAASNIKENVKNYLEEAKEKETTTEDGKKSIDSLISLMDHTEALVKESTSADGSAENIEAAIKEDFHNLGQATHTNAELVINNEQNENNTNDNNNG